MHGKMPPAILESKRLESEAEPMDDTPIEYRITPELLAQARVRGAFLLDGLPAPGPGDCLPAWWDLKATGATAAKK